LHERTGLFERSLKEHYHANKPALDRIGLSFLGCYIAGQAFIQKVGGWVCRVVGVLRRSVICACEVK
jgi:hypothetical protein